MREAQNVAAVPSRRRPRSTAVTRPGGSRGTASHDSGIAMVEAPAVSGRIGPDERRTFTAQERTGTTRDNPEQSGTIRNNLTRRRHGPRTRRQGRNRHRRQRRDRPRVRPAAQRGRRGPSFAMATGSRATARSTLRNVRDARAIVHRRRGGCGAQSASAGSSSRYARTLVRGSTSPNLASMSNRFHSTTPGTRSPTASRTTMGRKPSAMASSVE